jgi:septal ring factor EnvC (AmiA/AmiB activator)
VDIPTPSLDAAREREAAAARKRDEQMREANEWLREKERRDCEKAQGDADLRGTAGTRTEWNGVVLVRLTEATTGDPQSLPCK